MGTDLYSNVSCPVRTTDTLQQQVMLKSLFFSETEELMERLGEKPGRAEAILGWLYHDRCVWDAKGIGRTVSLVVQYCI